MGLACRVFVLVSRWLDDEGAAELLPAAAELLPPAAAELLWPAADEAAYELAGPEDPAGAWELLASACGCTVVYIVKVVVLDIDSLPPF